MYSDWTDDIDQLSASGKTKMPDRFTSQTRNSSRVVGGILIKDSNLSS